VTFLLTDVEGSTRRWESDAEGMRAALVVHDKVLRTAIELQGRQRARRPSVFGMIAPATPPDHMGDNNARPVYTDCVG
jgi:hypothetical protein